jgi:hypothetical protein
MMVGKVEGGKVMPLAKPEFSGPIASPPVEAKVLRMAVRWLGPSDEVGVPGESPRRRSGVPEQEEWTSQGTPRGWGINE